MKDILTTLGLKPEATEAEAVDRIKELQAAATSRSQGDAREKRIRTKISESGGALTRAQAIVAIEAQELADAQRKKK